MPFGSPSYESISEAIAELSPKNHTDIIVEVETSTIDMAFTPDTTVDNTHHDTIKSYRDKDPFDASSFPWPGSTFIIRCIEIGEVITLLNGHVIMARPGGRGSIHWVCEETKGWLGFRNPVSGKILGHSPGTMLCCIRSNIAGASISVLECRRRAAMSYS